MDQPSLPVPKPRNTLGPQSEAIKKPVPLPRTRVPSSNERTISSDLFRSIGSVSKQLTEDVAQKVQSSAKSANEKIEKTLFDGSRFAKDTIEKTLTTSRAVRDSVTKSVIEGTKTSLRLRKSKKMHEKISEFDSQRCVSMPAADVSLFDNIQFHSPMLEQKKYVNDGAEGAVMVHDAPSLNLNSPNLDDLSLFSSNSDSNTDTVSNFSLDSREFDHNVNCSNVDIEGSTYDTPKVSRANSIMSLRSAPEVPERRKKRESNLDFMRQNSLYENWILPGEPVLELRQESMPRPSKSTIYEFDPLNAKKSSKFEGVSNELLLLESFLIGDTYGSIQRTDSLDESFDEYRESDYYNPPTPPERTDSLFPVEAETTASAEAEVREDSTEKDSNSNWFSANNDNATKPLDEKPANTSVMQRFSNMLKFDTNKSASKQNVLKADIVEKPAINTMYVPHYTGVLTKVVSGGVEEIFKNSQLRYCVLSDQKLMCYTDPTNSILKEAFTLDSIYSLQIVLPLSSSSSNNNYCFEMAVSAGSLRNTPRKITFSCNSASERRNWAQKLSEHLCSGFPPKHTAEFTRFGWCYMKEGVSGDWQGAWVMLIRRVLVYCSGSEVGVRTVDLRKTRCVVTQDADEEAKQRCPADASATLLLDCPHATLYLRFPHERELKGWRVMVKLAAHNNGAYIHHQQLTKEDVPAVVDKCISFIYAHGSMSEGIYRRAGSSVVLAELLARFRRDAWSVQLSPGSHSEHDVAGVLKRFFRDLPEPLIPQEMHQDLVLALSVEDESTRHAEYRRLMSELPLVARKTARKLFAHLHFLHTMAHSNKMNAENLASVWAPTIMPAAVTSSTLQTAWSSKEVYVVRELIANFESIWEPTEGEKRREVAVRRVLMRVLSNAAAPAPRAAGDLKAWVHLRDRNNCFQVTLTPNKKSSDVCIELCEKMNMDSHLLMLEEVVCGDSLRRIIHVDEVVLDVVLRWGYWDEEDRKDNYLVINENKVLHQMDAMKSSNSLVCGQLKFASESSKTFKTHMFEFKHGKLCYFKDKQGSQQIEEWKINDIVWYTGHEPKRNPQSRWAITFISKKNKPKRSKESPWFGSTIAGSVTEDQLKWTTAMMYAEHSSVLPTPRLVIT